MCVCVCVCVHVRVHAEVEIADHFSEMTNQIFCQDIKCMNVDRKFVTMETQNDQSK